MRASRRLRGARRLLGALSILCVAGCQAGSDAEPTGPGTEVTMGVEHCPDAPQPCGGDITGRWRLRQACHSIEEARANDPGRCRELLDRRIRVYGSVEIDASRKLTSSISMKVRDRMLYSPSCFEGRCETLTSDENDEGGDCQQHAGRCECEIRFTPPPETLLPELESQLQRGEYCVRGGLLLVEDLENTGGKALVFERD